MFCPKSTPVFRLHEFGGGIVPPAVALTSSPCALRHRLSRLMHFQNPKWVPVLYSAIFISKNARMPPEGRLAVEGEPAKPYKLYRAGLNDELVGSLPKRIRRSNFGVSTIASSISTTQSFIPTNGFGLPQNNRPHLFLPEPKEHRDNR